MPNKRENIDSTMGTKVLERDVDHWQAPGIQWRGKLGLSYYKCEQKVKVDQRQKQVQMVQLVTSQSMPENGHHHAYISSLTLALQKLVWYSTSKDHLLVLALLG